MDRSSKKRTSTIKYEIPEITDENLGILSNYLFRDINQKILESRYIFRRICIFFYFLLEFILISCSTNETRSNYNYPSKQQKRVMELCTLVFSDPHYQYISPSRRAKLNKIRTSCWGFWATFADGRTYRVPIISGLNIGEDYYCSFSLNSEYCPKRNDLNYDCEWE